MKTAESFCSKNFLLISNLAQVKNPLEYISRALSPARVVKVVETGDESAMAVVPDDKLSLAIGRSGQNARLAVRLTGWKIDVKSESESGEDLAVEEPIEE